MALNAGRKLILIVLNGILFFFHFGTAIPIRTSIGGREMIRMANRCRHCMKMRSIWYLVFSFSHWSVFRFYLPFHRSRNSGKFKSHIQSHFPIHSTPSFPRRSFFFFRTTKDPNLFGLEMFTPFASTIWWSLLSMILLASSIMTFIFRWEYRMKPVSASLRSDSTMLTAFAVFCQQGVARTPALSSGRCLLIFLFLSSIMIYNYYTSLLVSGLVGSSSQTNIKNSYDLANSKLDIGFDDVPYIKGFLTVCRHRPISLISIFHSFCLFLFRQPPNRNSSILLIKNWIAAAKVISHRPCLALVMASAACNVVLLHSIAKHPPPIQWLEKPFRSRKFAMSTKYHFEKINSKGLSCARHRRFWLWFQRVSIGCAKLVCCRNTNAIGWPRNHRAYRMLSSPASASITLRRFSYFSSRRTSLRSSWWFWKMLSIIASRRGADEIVEIEMQQKKEIIQCLLAQIELTRCTL